MAARISVRVYRLFPRVLQALCHVQRKVETRGLYHIVAKTSCMLPLGPAGASQQRLAPLSEFFLHTSLICWLCI